MDQLVTRSRSEPNAFARDLFDGLPTRYDLLAEVLSFGQNGRWRAAMVDAVTAMKSKPRRVLDVATGTAGVALMLAERTEAAITGVDLTANMVGRGRERVSQSGHADRIRLVLGRAEQLPFPDSTFDAVTFTYLMRYVADPAATIGELARVLRPGGRIASLEFAVPTNEVWRAGWFGYTRVLLPLAGLALGGREWFRVGRFLGPSISAYYRTYPIGWIRDSWERAGIAGVTVRPMSLGSGVVMWGTKT